MTDTAGSTTGQSTVARIDDATLALLLLGLHDGNRAWKTFDWDSLSRLHAKGLINNPVSRTKSVVLSASGLAEAQDLFDRLFGAGPD